MNGKFLLFGRDETENSLIRFVDRKISEQRRDERRLAERRTTKYRFQARNSCIADARSYRVARRFPVLASRAIRLESSNSQAPDLSIRNRLTQEPSKRALANCERGQLAIFHSRA